MLAGHDSVLAKSTYRQILQFAVNGVNGIRLCGVSRLWRALIEELPFWRDELLEDNETATLLADEKCWKDAWVKRRALRNIRVDSWETSLPPIMPFLPKDLCEIVFADNQDARSTLLFRRLAHGYRLVTKTRTRTEPLLCFQDCAGVDGDRFVHAVQIVNPVTAEWLAATLFCTEVDECVAVLTDSHCVLAFSQTPSPDPISSDWSPDVREFVYNKSGEFPPHDAFVVFSLHDLDRPLVAFFEPDGIVDPWEVESYKNCIYYPVTHERTSQMRVRKVEIDARPQAAVTLKKTCYVTEASSCRSFRLDTTGQVVLLAERGTRAVTRFNVIQDADDDCMAIKMRSSLRVARCIPHAPEASLERTSCMLSANETYLVTQCYNDICGPQQWTIFDLMNRTAQLHRAENRLDYAGGSLTWVGYKRKSSSQLEVALLRLEDSQILHKQDFPYTLGPRPDEDQFEKPYFDDSYF